jgi:hypothetical protein
MLWRATPAARDFVNAWVSRQNNTDNEHEQAGLIYDLSIHDIVNRQAPRHQ